jgi:Skp family chaperone for outer membrane proteins
MRTQNLAKPNFEFQKRQKELEKKRRKEEKKQKKLDRAAAQTPGGVESPPAETS